MCPTGTKPTVQRVMHSTRERILAHLKRQPGQGVDALAGVLGLAPMTIRQHLDKMMADSLIEAQIERRPVGRPARAYFLTPQGEERFPRAYDRLAELLLDELSAADGGVQADGVGVAVRREELLQRIARRAAAPHLEELEELDGSQRWQAVSEILHQESGFTELDDCGDGYELREYNCVYQRVAESHNDVCAFHTRYVGELVGQMVELVSCRCSGADVCGFRLAL